LTYVVLITFIIATFIIPLFNLSHASQKMNNSMQYISDETVKLLLILL